MIVHHTDFSPMKLTHTPTPQPTPPNPERLARLEQRLAEAEAQRERAYIEWQAAEDDQFLHNVYLANVSNVQDWQRAVNVAKGGQA